MKMRKSSPAIVTLLALTLAIHARPAHPVKLTPPVRDTGQTLAKNAGPAGFEESRRDGIKALYSIEYPEAHAKFREMAKLNPDHPAGHYYQAKTYWLETLFGMRRLQIGLYACDSFLSTKEERSSPPFDKEFHDNIARALNKANSLFMRNANDVEALYYWGAARSLLATYEATVTHSFFTAMINGYKALKQQREVVEKNPTFADAYLSVGLYDYIAGTLPPAWKRLLVPFIAPGNRTKGLWELHRAAQEGNDAVDDARVILSALYQREKGEANLNEALNLMDELCRKYPKNYIYSMDRATILEQLGCQTESYEAFELVLKDERARACADLVHYRYGEALFHGWEFKRALEQFDEVIKTPNAEAALISLARLRKGESFDALQQHTEAIDEYRQVKEVYDLQDKARRYQKRPYQPERPSQKKPPCGL
jgi:tetratricopeptide (TPR) repeat protein